MDKQIENVNPQSLCDLINEVVQKRFAGNISEAAATFDKARNKKRMQFEFSRNALTQIIENKQKITYLHLEMIADYLQIPAGVFLLFSRIRADKRDETAIEAIEARTDILALQELLKWISAEEISGDLITLDDLNFTYLDSWARKFRLAKKRISMKGDT